MDKHGKLHLGKDYIPKLQRLAQLTGKNDSDAVRHYYKRGRLARIKPGPPSEPRYLPRVKGLCCGSPRDFSALLADEELPRSEISDIKLLRLATAHSFIGIADGWSMNNGNLPDSIAHNDELLMVPYEEWRGNLVPGLIVLAHVIYKDGRDGCTLKEYTGAALQPHNPKFKAIEFGPEVASAQALAICVARLPKLFVQP